MSATPISDVYGPNGSVSGGQHTAAVGHGSIMLGPPPSRWGTMGLGVLSALVVFGVTLSLLMTFANPKAAPATAPATMAPDGRPSAAGGFTPAPGGMIESAVEPAPQSVATHGELSIKAEPIAAEVLVDGRSVGNAPFEGVLTAGAHDVRLQAEGFQAWESNVEVVLGERQNLNVVLTPVESDPSDAGRRRSRKASKSSKKSADDDDGEESEAITPEPPRKLDGGSTGFKKVSRSDDAGSDFKKLDRGPPGKVEKLR